MQLDTTRFGLVSIEPDDLLHFPAGLIGFEDLCHWVLLADAENEALGWLQSASRPETALAVVSPRRYIPHYRVRVARGEVETLALGRDNRAFVLAVLAKTGEDLTANLKAPVIINLDRRLGRQVVTSDDQPVQYVLSGPSAELRKSA